MLFLHTSTVTALATPAAAVVATALIPNLTFLMLDLSMEQRSPITVIILHTMTASVTAMILPHSTIVSFPWFMEQIMKGIAPHLAITSLPKLVNQRKKQLLRLEVQVQIVLLPPRPY